MVSAKSKERGEGMGGRKRPLCPVHPGRAVNRGPRETGRQANRPLVYKRALIGARAHTHTYTACARHRCASTVLAPALCRVGAADNMQLRAVSSTLPCSHSVVPRVISRNASRPRGNAWRNAAMKCTAAACRYALLPPLLSSPLNSRFTFNSLSFPRFLSPPTEEKRKRRKKKKRKESS